MKKVMIYLLPGMMLLGATQNSMGQKPWVKELLNKVSNFYLNKSKYHIDMTFTMYRGIKGNAVTESYTATMEKNGSYSKNSISGTLVYRFPKAQVVVDNTSKKIIYSKPNTGTQNSPIDLKAYITHYEKSQVLDKGSQWVCEFVSTQNSFSKLPYGKVLLYINKSDYRVTKQILYFSNLIPFQEKGTTDVVQDYGRLHIDLAYDFDMNIEKKELKHFILATASNKIQPQKDFANYQLIDQTEYNK